MLCRPSTAGGASDDFGHLRCREEPAVVMWGWQRIVARDGLNDAQHMVNERSSHLGVNSWAKLDQLVKCFC